MIECTRHLWPVCIRLVGGALLVLLTPGLLAAQQAASDSPAPATSGSPSLAAPMNPALFEGLWQPGGQDAPAIPDYRSPECPGCPTRNWGRAVAATIGVNVIFTLTNLAFRPDERYEFQVTPQTWWDNLKYGFIFDDNNFLINQFGHPYQGGLYFSTGRANGLNYWESSALVALGSFTWECCGETNRASMNDYFSTTMGGMVMGEIQHRMATLVLDTTATEGRIAREVAAAVIDPVGGFFRIIHGEWGKVRENRPDRRPDVLSMSLQTGALWRGAGGTLDEASAFPYVELDFGYGDLVRTPFRKPFDAFQSSFVLGGGKGVSELVVLGRVYGKSLSQSPAGAASFLITQGFAYLTNPAYDLGGQSVDDYLDFLVQNQESHLSSDRYYWMADSYPAAGISLRSASPGSFVLQAEGGTATGMRTVGVVDGESALWMVHPGAVYLHEGQPYLVESLDLEKKIARLQPFDGDYLTESVQHTSIEVLSTNQREPPQGSESSASHSHFWGELQVTTQVVGFRKLRWLSRESLGEHPLDLPPTDLQTTGYWLSISPATVEQLGREGLWTNFPNDYGPGWGQLRDAVRKRDEYRCQVCGQPETSRQHEVHHKIPFRLFRDEAGRPLREKANQPDNLVTLCPDCHKQVEQNIRVRSGLSGLAYALGNLAPLFLMCDPNDLGRHVEPVRSAAFPEPSVVLYDLVPAGIGFSQMLFEMHTDLLARALELVQNCPCESGCPSCVGPGGENGLGGKTESLALMKLLTR